jgi:mutual gliding-motility protein MglA
VVFFNYTTMQVSAKIVYYGPGLCGKTTNLQQIHGRTDPSSRGEMVSLETEADRTLFFDLLPLEVGTIGGMRVRLQLYTVPGQVFYNTTRKLVLKGVDGIVFVADSQEPMLDANVESLSNLKRNLAELNQPLEKIPFLFQFNKRDLRNILAVETMNRHLNREGYEVYEGAALHGVGVFETLKAISRKTLAAVHRKITGEQDPPRRPVESVPVAPSQAKSVPVVEAAVAAETGTGTRIGTAEPAETVVMSPSPSKTRQNPMFAELEEELDPNAVAITERESVAPEETAEPETIVLASSVEEADEAEQPDLATRLADEAKTGEVKVEFAENPSLAGRSEGEIHPPAGAPRRVATKSRLDVERELEALRAMALGTGRVKKAAEPPPTLIVAAKGKAAVPKGAITRANGLVVDVKLVGDGMSHASTGVIRCEMPPHEAGERRARLRLEVELQEDDDV